MTLGRLRVVLLAATALTALPALANPLGPQVAAGTVQIDGLGTDALSVQQSSDKAIVNWNTFDIDLGETTTIMQPRVDSVLLNRVTGGLGAAQILGTLTANGQVFLINPDGVLFGKNATVDVGALVVTTHDLFDGDFLSGNYEFKLSGSPDASIVNLGTISVTDGGFAALVAPGVRNDGVIRANLGKVSLASANAFSLDFYGDGLIKLGLSDAIAEQIIDVETGLPLSALIGNSGLLQADGGSVQLTAAAARQVLDSVINNTGVIEADTIGTHNGKIILSASTQGTKPAGATAQKAKVSGRLSATGTEAGETGGTIQITGEDIELAVATIDAFGWNGGGTVLIGGDVGGGQPNRTVIPESVALLGDQPLSNASSVSLSGDSSIDASATVSGNGGKVVLWSDGDTSAHGRIDVRGGELDGDGGFAEVSGHAGLSIADLGVRVDAKHGQAGTALFDPQWLVVDAANVGTFVDILNQGGTAILYGRAGQDADNLDHYGVSITVGIKKTTAGTATLKVFGDPGVEILPGVKVESSGGPLNVLLDAFPSQYFGLSSPYDGGSIIKPGVYPYVDETLFNSPVTVANFDLIIGGYQAPRAIDGSFPGTPTPASDFVPGPESVGGPVLNDFVNYVYSGDPTIQTFIGDSWVGQPFLETTAEVFGATFVNPDDIVLKIGAGAQINTNGGTFSAVGAEYLVTRDLRTISTMSESAIATYYSSLQSQGYDFLQVIALRPAESTGNYQVLTLAFDLDRRQLTLPTSPSQPKSPNDVAGSKPFDFVPLDQGLGGKAALKLVKIPDWGSTLTAIVFPMQGKGLSNISTSFGAHGANEPGIAYEDWYRSGQYHVALDISANGGDPVVSPISGTIVYYHEQNGDPMQTFIVISGDDGKDYVLGHVNCTQCGSSVTDTGTYPVSSQVRVMAGQKIGTIIAMPDDHLHFGVNTSGLIDNSGRLKEAFRGGGWGRITYTEGDTKDLADAETAAANLGWIDPATLY